MKLPSFIKLLARFCNKDSPGYSLANIAAARAGDGIARLTATDGMMLASVHWEDDHDGPEMNVLVNGKQLSCPPAAAFKAKPSQVPRFDGTKLTCGGKAMEPESNTTGRFPRYESAFRIYDEPDGYTAVKVDPWRLKGLCELAGSMGDGGLTLWIKGPGEFVFAAAQSRDGHVARMALAPLGVDGEQDYQFPARPGPADAVAATPRKTACKRPAQRTARATPSSTHDWGARCPAL